MARRTESPVTTEPTHPGSGTAPPPSNAHSIDELLQRAIGGSAAPTVPAPAQSSQPQPSQPQPSQPLTPTLPERPSRVQISAALLPLAGPVRACAQGQTGIATVAMVIRGDGAVQSASVQGPFSVNTNRCIQDVVRRVRFPAFSRVTVPLVYPFSIQR